LRSQAHNKNREEEKEKVTEKTEKKVRARIFNHKESFVLTNTEAENRKSKP
jgi:hypothetical protein